MNIISIFSWRQELSDAHPTTIMWVNTTANLWLLSVSYWHTITTNNNPLLHLVLLIAQQFSDTE